MDAWTGDSESWYLYNKDIRESTISLTAADGSAAATYEYDDFGSTTVTSGADIDNEICYTGQIYDKSSGLYYYNARYYDPENARFLTQDTYRGEATQTDTLHLYAYCKNNPINYTDPSGHRMFSVSEGTTYAKKYAEKSNKNSPYYKSGDWTNFASQILYSGGISMTGDWHAYRNSSTEAWRLADKFVKYWGTYKTFKRKKEQKSTQIYRLTKNAKKGDFIAYDKTGNGSWDHVAYVTDKSGNERTVLGRKVYNIEIAQHTRDYCAWRTNTKKMDGFLSIKSIIQK